MCEESSSETIANLLMLVVAIILAAVILTAVLGYFNFFYDLSVPCVFQIQSVKHTDDHGVMNNNGLVSLINIGDVDYINYQLFARTYVNGDEKEVIQSMNNDEFIGTHHFDVWHLIGPGTHGNSHFLTSRWYAGQPVFIDYKNGLIHPGDTIVIEVYDKSTGNIISRDTWPRTDPRNTTEWWVSRFIHPAA